uniref:Uncharacterized protein n=1 Tax=viral metagenome TaxID=1070528 RepID=A0A6M3L1S1_9ZZZZ
MLWDLSILPSYFRYGQAILATLVLLILAVLCFYLSGCSTVKRPVVKDGSLRAFSLTQQDNLEQKFQEVIDYCEPRLQGYENKSNVQASKAYWMNMSGLVSGAVIAPALLASGVGNPIGLGIITALSGWAGATPFASESLKVSGLSGSAVAEMRNAIVERIRDKAAIALDATKPYDERRAAIMGIVGECTIYPIVIPGE